MPSGIWSKLDPAISRTWLYAIAGTVWTAVGLMLAIRAAGWLRGISTGTALLIAPGGIVLAVIAYRYLFIRIVRRNIRRIAGLPERVCLFAFTAWRGYLMIILMVSLGVLLRSSPIPRSLLAVSYTIMGGVLLLGSVRFYTEFYSVMTGVRSGRNRIHD